MKTFTGGMPEDCRRFRAELPEHLDAAGPTPGRHEESCAACQSALACARAVRDSLASQPVPAVPAELSAESFLEGIFEKAHGATAAAVGSLLSKALTSTNAPADADWAGTLPGHAGAALRSLASPRTPDWVWARVRADLRTHVSQQRLRRRLRVAGALAAAGIVVAAVLLLRAGPDQGTVPEPTIVFRVVESPPVPAASPLPTLRRIGRTDW